MNLSGGAELAKNNAMMVTTRVVGILAGAIGALSYNMRANGSPAANKNHDLIAAFAWAACTANLVANSKLYEPMYIPNLTIQAGLAGAMLYQVRRSVRNGAPHHAAPRRAAPAHPAPRRAAPASAPRRTAPAFAPHRTCAAPQALTPAAPAAPRYLPYVCAASRLTLQYSTRK
jgi:hypothetical protein